ncbi:FMN-dependent NADH-azoreductase [Pseudohoeflea suaedae]|uniref:FMN dependent NADH:quinone oxidoreductase n=1 Tax=Pseudohoeflea suaedae TaxID=877384 RepID=A0A4R5PHE9_9HYPH|nr:FMN-dependent NADH-azoreductase [Pseudohoeflea suaedae]TDH34242.1 FMN-dependent NADH-azoreductase [Pseudohoeflea suaedae]
MTNILVVNSSALGPHSVSKALVDSTVEKLKVSSPDAKIVVRDVGASPIPHMTADNVVPEPETEGQKAARKLSDDVIGEVQDADIIVIGAPMYNFGIPSTLKAWFDHLLRAGVTFRYTEAGPEGLLKGKRAIVVLSRGGLYSEGPLQVLDAQEPHLNALLGFVGITDVTYVRAEKLAFSPEDREASIANAQTEVHAVASKVAAA